jgi:hypothetical protein
MRNQDRSVFTANQIRNNLSRRDCLGPLNTKIMKCVTLVVALAPAVVADYVKYALFPASGSCDGVPAILSGSAIDCESDGVTSYKLECVNSTGANIVAYTDNANCSGIAAVSLPYEPGPGAFGCFYGGSSTSTMYTCQGNDVTNTFNTCRKFNQPIDNSPNPPSWRLQGTFPCREPVHVQQRRHVPPPG